MVQVASICTLQPEGEKSTSTVPISKPLVEQLMVRQHGVKRLYTRSATKMVTEV